MSGNGCKSVVVGLVLVCVALPVLADDLNPAPWRGDPRTTLQMWEFGADNNTTNPMPDVWVNEFGPQAATVNPTQPWFAVYAERDGVWKLSGDIEVPIFNYFEPLLEKRIWIQITWTPVGASVNSQAWVDDIALAIPGQLVGQEPLENGWTHTTHEIVLQPNPEMEWVKVWGDFYIDELVIETICIPEPATITLLALGALATTLRRRRRKG